MSRKEPDFITSLVAGGASGTAVDVALFPLDTIKTRLQSSQGFHASGGFRGIYSGLGPAAIASAPGAALFFSTYETVKKLLGQRFPERYQVGVHMSAAAVGEVVACLVRVPTEIVKQRMQARQYNSAILVIRDTIRQEGFYGIYRGYFSTVAREIPFSFIQFPLWELAKKSWSNYQGHYVDSWQSALCGGAAGGVSAAVTTPLDVAKTRIMLAKADTTMAKASTIQALSIVRSANGMKGLFAGVVPRTMWISIGGAVFFGVYEKVKFFLCKENNENFS